MSRITQYLTECIESNKPVNFCKFGDGEYLCMGQNKQYHSNCDGDMFFPELGNKLVEAFIYLCSHKNTFIGKWHSDEITLFLEKLVPFDSIPYASYHTLINDEEFNKNSHLFDFVKAVQRNNRKKIIISNNKNKVLLDIFSGNVYIGIPEKCWFSDYDSIKSQIMTEIEDNCIIIAAAGLCSKWLACEILRTNDTVSYLDIGSGFDYLCGKNSRGWKHSREDELNYYKDLLPPNFA